MGVIWWCREVLLPSKRLVDGTVGALFACARNAAPNRSYALQRRHYEYDWYAMYVWNCMWWNMFLCVCGLWSVCVFVREKRGTDFYLHYYTPYYHIYLYYYLYYIQLFCYGCGRWWVIVTVCSGFAIP